MALKVVYIRIVFFHKSESLSSVVIDSRSRDDGALLHVPVVGHASPAVGPVHDDRLHDGDGLKGKKVAAAGSGMLESE